MCKWVDSNHTHNFRSLYAFKHNWPLQFLQPFCQDYGIASYNNRVVCVNFIRGWWDQLFTSTLYYRFLRNFFIAVLFILRVFARNLSWPLMSSEKTINCSSLIHTLQYNSRLLGYKVIWRVCQCYNVT